jgi:hypothetical protein
VEEKSHINVRVVLVQLPDLRFEVLIGDVRGGDVIRIDDVEDDGDRREGRGQWKLRVQDQRLLRRLRPTPWDLSQSGVGAAQAEQSGERETAVKDGRHGVVLAG